MTNNLPKRPKVEPENISIHRTTFRDIMVNGVKKQKRVSARRDKASRRLPSTHQVAFQ